MSQRTKRLGSFVFAVALVVFALVVFDLVCAALGVFPPQYNYGIPDLGWAPEMTGAMVDDACPGPKGTKVRYVRNEMGIRTSRTVTSLRSDSASEKIAVVGDSHTDLCAPNEQTHPGILETILNRDGLPSVVLSYGMGRYSPLQSYLLFDHRLKQFGPKVLVLNFYSGNDFYDMLRVDDRAHFVADSGGYRMAPALWYAYDDPDLAGWERSSRVLFIGRSIARATGVANLYTRVRYLMATAAEQEPRWTSRVRSTTSYLRAVQRGMAPSLEYPAAFDAQMLNQGLFFRYFPGSREESVRRTAYLLRLIRKQNPDLLLVLSPIPSYQLAQIENLDSAYVATLARMPFTIDEARREELGLYDDLRAMAPETGWLFVDNLTALSAYSGPDRLYNQRDYHITPAASEIIGALEAKAILDASGKAMEAGPQVVTPGQGRP